jgi:hypothetical protein
MSRPGYEPAVLPGGGPTGGPPDPPGPSAPDGAPPPLGAEPPVGVVLMSTRTARATVYPLVSSPLTVPSWLTPSSSPKTLSFSSLPNPAGTPRLREIWVGVAVGGGCDIVDGPAGMGSSTRVVADALDVRS